AELGPGQVRVAAAQAVDGAKHPPEGVAELVELDRAPAWGARRPHRRLAGGDGSGGGHAGSHPYASASAAVSAAAPSRARTWAPPRRSARSSATVGISDSTEMPSAHQ